MGESRNEVEKKKKMSRRNTGSFSSAQLLCRNECGFYGNTQWNGYCSLCWRHVQKSDDSYHDLTLEVASLKTQPDSKNSSKRSSISEHDDAEIIPRNIHALCTKKDKRVYCSAGEESVETGLG